MKTYDINVFRLYFAKKTTAYQNNLSQHELLTLYLSRIEESLFTWTVDLN